VEIKIGIAHLHRDLEIEVESPDEILQRIQQALAQKAPLIEVRDHDGARYVIASDKLTYVEVPAEKKRAGVGFAR
jgi:hypothetical protein